MKNIFPYTLMRIGGIPFEKLDLLNIHSLLFDEIYQDKKKLQDTIALENKFNKDLIRIRENIKKLSKEFSLTNGLMLSAPSLHLRIVSYQHKEIASFRKKEKQTERTIVQYLTRIGTKTSPFSTFTQIGLAKIKEQSNLIENTTFTANQSFVRINNYILKCFKDSIIQDRTLIQGLELRVNSSLIKLEHGYEFLVNDNNIEAFQTIDGNPVVDLVVKKIEQNQTILFRDLIKQLLVEVDATIEDVENFVLELHKIGLFEFQMHISNLDANWELKCLDLLDTLPESQLAADWMKLLLQLIEAKQKYPHLHFSEREILLKKAFERFSDMFEKVNQTIPIAVENEKAVFKKQFQNQLTFTKTNLLYEDYAVESKTSISIEKIKALLSKLSRFIDTLKSLEDNKEIGELTDFHKSHYDKQSVDLLDFHKAFSTWKLSNRANSISTDNFDKKLKEWKSKIKNKVSINNNSINISLETLESTILDVKEKRQQSHSVFVQLYESNNEFKCFLNSAMPGYGKYFSRFLHLFPDEVTHQLQERNIRKEQFLAEINDNSFFNANIHPPLMPYEIKGTNDNMQVPVSRQFLLKDIEVRLENDSLKLVSKVLAREIIPFDLGFQALVGRSELFKLLNAFTEASFSPTHLLISTINDTIKNQDHIRIFPRITIENQITIQRKTWIIPKNSIPKAQQKHETEWILYKRILNWQKENNLPLEAFYTINPKELAKDKTQIRNNDAYKPQYIDFRNPMLVQLFIRSCKNIETSLKLVEMLPNQNKLLSWNNEKYVSEFLFQWEN